MNRHLTLDFDPEVELTKLLNWLGRTDVTVRDTGLKVVIESDGAKNFFLYAPGTSLELMQGHVVSWLMSERNEGLAVARGADGTHKQVLSRVASACLHYEDAERSAEQALQDIADMVEEALRALEDGGGENRQTLGGV